MPRKNKKNREVSLFERYGLLSGIGGALIAGAVGLFIHINKGDGSPNSQTCTGDNCVQINDNKGTVNIGRSDKESKED